MVVVAVAELAKRSAFRSALLASPQLLLALPALPRAGGPFRLSLGASCAIKVGAYFALIRALGRPGIRI